MNFTVSPLLRKKSLWNKIKKGLRKIKHTWNKRNNHFQKRITDPNEKHNELSSSKKLGHPWKSSNKPEAIFFRLGENLESKRFYRALKVHMRATQLIQVSNDVEQDVHYATGYYPPSID